jgi:cytochrome c-type biogenesis protein CcmE
MRTHYHSTVLFGMALALSSCGGGTGGTGATNGGSTSAVSIGVMQKGSVIVNGVHFDSSTATIRINDATGADSQLQSGMHVKVRGVIDGSLVNGTAQQVEVNSEVRGTVKNHDPNASPPTFTVVDQTVFVDDLTVFAGFTSATITAIGELVDGTSVVEVHGLRDATGNIHASRVELLTLPPADSDELRGTVKPGTLNTNAKTFNLANGTNSDVAVSYNGALVFPAGGNLTEGAIVEVHGTFSPSLFTAVRIDLEELEDAQFEPVSGDEYEMEGLVSGCGTVNPCVTFSVGDRAVQVNTATRFEGGSPTDLADGVTVEAEGHQFTGSTLIAEKVEFKRTRVVLIGQVTAFSGVISNGTGNTGTVTVLGKTVQINTLTQVNASTPSGTPVIDSNDRVQIQGYVDSSDNIVADSIADNAGGNASRVTLQAPVTAKNGSILTLLGINADLNGATQLFDTSGMLIDLPTFLSMINAVPSGGTLVKVTGAFNAGSPSTITSVEEGELEN